MTITGGSAHSKDEIDRIKQEAEAHANKDKQRREEAEIRNTGDSLLYQTEKFLKDNEGKFEGELATQKSELDTALAELKTTLEGANFEMIKSATEKVSTLSQALGGALYAANAAQAEGAPAAEDGVEDAEVVEEEQA
jgi:molecular chaperone DnaK